MSPEPPSFSEEAGRASLPRMRKEASVANSNGVTDFSPGLPQCNGGNPGIPRCYFPTPTVLCPGPQIPPAWTQALQACTISGCLLPRVASALLRQPWAEIRKPVGLGFVPGDSGARAFRRHLPSTFRCTPLNLFPTSGEIPASPQAVSVPRSSIPKE